MSSVDESYVFVDSEYLPEDYEICASEVDTSEGPASYDEAAGTGTVGASNWHGRVAPCRHAIVIMMTIDDASYVYSVQCTGV